MICYKKIVKSNIPNISKKEPLKDAGIYMVWRRKSRNKKCYRKLIHLFVL